ncbi:MAG: hypothetical protein CM15mP12_7940 [Gammaproteobacteria bacterium]|nr:MAG: hypothetical protein CM15mP12_7940 [Gammaproteobacteria bacterium]
MGRISSTIISSKGKLINPRIPHEVHKLALQIPFHKIPIGFSLSLSNLSKTLLMGCLPKFCAVRVSLLVHQKGVPIFTLFNKYLNFLFIIVLNGTTQSGFRIPSLHNHQEGHKTSFLYFLFVKILLVSISHFLPT